MRSQVRKFERSLGIILIGALGGSIADCLPPARAQDLSSDQQLLVSINAHMREELSHLPDYTCLESVARFQNQPARQHPKLERMDTVRLEVVYSNHREWYGSPGDKNFSINNPLEFIGVGMIGTGTFAMIAHNVFEIAQITYQGREDLGGRSAVKYDFRLPRPALKIDLPGGSGTVGQEGSFWVDAKSLDVIRLEAHAIEIPPYVPLVEDSTQVNYARTRIGGYSALLPQQADLHMSETAGQESYDRIEFTHCRAFSAQSVIHFGTTPHDSEPLPSESLKTISAPGAVLEAVPPFLLVTMRLKTPITDKDAVGTLIEATISGDVRRKGNTVIPNGSLVRGRIRRLERYANGRNDEFIVALEFTEVEVNGGPLRLYADLLKMDKRREIRPNLYEQVLVRSVAGVEARTQTVTVPELPGVASFFVRGRTFTLTSGFGMVWRTRGLTRQ